jgi:hypothetical protein
MYEVPTYLWYGTGQLWAITPKRARPIGGKSRKKKKEEEKKKCALQPASLRERRGLGRYQAGLAQPSKQWCLLWALKAAVANTAAPPTP